MKATNISWFFVRYTKLDTFSVVSTSLLILFFSDLRSHSPGSLMGGHHEQSGQGSEGPAVLSHPFF